MGNKFFIGMEDPDGNVYIVETDETLEKSGVPADAAVVGEKFKGLSKEIDDLNANEMPDYIKTENRRKYES